MAIDLKQRQLDQEKRVDDLLAQRPGADTGGISSELGGIRQNFFSRVAPQLGGFAKQAFAQVSPRVERASADTLAVSKSKNLRESLNRNFNFVFNRLVQSGVNQRAAYQYANKIAMDSINRKARSEDAAGGRVQSLAEEDILDDVSRTRMTMQRQATDQQAKEMTRQALIRSLFGLAGTVGTGVALSRAGGGKNG